MLDGIKVGRYSREIVEWSSYRYKRLPRFNEPMRSGKRSDRRRRPCTRREKEKSVTAGSVPFTGIEHRVTGPKDLGRGRMESNAKGD